MAGALLVKITPHKHMYYHRQKQYHKLKYFNWEKTGKEFFRAFPTTWATQGLNEYTPRSKHKDYGNFSQ